MTEISPATFFLTVDQIRDIFEAGVARGEEISAAYEWGEKVTGTDTDALIDAFHSIINEGKDWLKDDNYTDRATVESWFVKD